jgi:hypothetical protein
MSEDMDGYFDMVYELEMPSLSTKRFSCKVAQELYLIDKDYAHDTEWGE